METIFIEQFEETFKLPFKDVVNIQDLGADTDDDGIDHFIHISSKNVYSFDTNDNVWLEKNLFKNDILQRLIIDIHEYEKGVGPIFACQLSIKMFIEDLTNDFTQRKYAETIYEWLGMFDDSIDELCAVSYDKSVFILKALERYEINTRDSNLILNYGDAIGSLQYQINLTK